MRRGVLLVLALLAPLASACALNPPRIVSISPGREATNVATNQAISISFDRPMSHDSVEQRFGLTPTLPGCNPSKSCHFAWSGNTLMFIHPHVNFELSTAYRVSMHAGYADASGQQNGLEHSWRFITEGPPALTAVDPPDNATAVAPDRNIVLTFSRPMRADSMRAAVQLSPDVPFLLRPRPGGEGSQFEIIPTAALQPNQSYTVSVDQPLDVHDNAIYGRVQTRFRTGSLALSRKIGYLVAQPGQPAFAVGIVDPHADAFLGRSTPKIIYRLSVQSQLEDAILSFDWSPDAQRLVVVQAPRNADSGPIQIVDLATATVIRPGINGSAVYWSQDGTIVYLRNGLLRRFRPLTLEDVALTDSADGRVNDPVALSPDAFRRLTAAGPELWIYDLSASGASTYRRGGPLDITGAAWLNDNSTLFVATGTGNSAALYRVNIFSAGEAGGVVKVTGSKDAPNGSTPTTPAYDRRVSFVGQVDQLPQVCVMNGDGSRPQQLTEWEADYPYTGKAPNWVPIG